jgi:lysophospholipase L1-like esterase
MRRWRRSSSKPFDSDLRTDRVVALAFAALAAACNGSLYRPTGIPRLAATRFLAFGDSMTQGVPSECPPRAPLMTLDELMLNLGRPGLAASAGEPWSYPSLLQTDFADRYASQSPVVVNRGIGGETLAEGLARIDRLLQEEQPQILLMLEGANDVNQRTPPAAVGQTVAAIVRTARARHVPAFVATLPPQRPRGIDGSCRGFEPGGVPPTNEQIRAAAVSEGAVVVDLFEAFGSASNSLIGPDGLHPTDLGYRRIAESFSTAIRQRLED